MKRWWLPTQKGTELWPRTTVQPPKLVIEGVETGTPLYRAVAQRYAGQLKQFHGHAQQDYSLSSNGQVKRHIEFTGARATYLNVQGQETLRLQVDHKVLVEEEVKLGDYWTWALLDIEVPHTSVSDDVLGAAFKARRLIPGPHEAGVHEFGEAYSGGHFDDGSFDDGLDPFVISYPLMTTPYRTVVRGNDTTQITSLIVDMRRFPKAQVVLDIYGTLNMGSSLRTFAYRRDPGPNHFTSSFTNLGPVTYPEGWPFDPAGRLPFFTNLGFNVPITDTDNAPLTAVIPGLGTLDPGMDNEVYVPAPSVVFKTGENTAGPSDTATEWSDNATYHPESNLLTGITGYSYYQHYDPTLPSDIAPSSPNSFIGSTILSWDITELKRVVFAEPTSRLCPVRGNAGFGWPHWETTRFNAPFNNFGEWDVLEQLPDHMPTRHLADVTIASAPAEGDPYQYLGRLTIDPVLKSLSFKPA